MEKNLGTIPNPLEIVLQVAFMTPESKPECEVSVGVRERAKWALYKYTAGSTPYEEEHFKQGYLAGFKAALEEAAKVAEEMTTVPPGEWGNGAKFNAVKIRDKIVALGDGHE